MTEKMSGIEIWKMLKEKLNRYNLAAAEIDTKCDLDPHMETKPESTKKPDLVDAIDTVSGLMAEFVKKHMQHDDDFSEETVAVLKEIVPSEDIPKGLKKMFGAEDQKEKKKTEKVELGKDKKPAKESKPEKQYGSKKFFIENLIRENKYTAKEIFEKTIENYPGKEASTKVMVSQVKKFLGAIADKKTKILMAD